MSKFKFTIRSEYVTTVVIEADDEMAAYSEMAGYLEDGGTGDEETGYWSSREYDEPPEELCNYCKEPVKNMFNLPCCRDRLKDEMKKHREAVKKIVTEGI